MYIYIYIYIYIDANATLYNSIELSYTQQTWSKRLLFVYIYIYIHIYLYIYVCVCIYHIVLYICNCIPWVGYFNRYGLLEKFPGNRKEHPCELILHLWACQIRDPIRPNYAAVLLYTLGYWSIKWLTRLSAGFWFRRKT